MRKLFLALASILSLTAHAGLDNLASYIFDSNGNILNSTSNALNSYITNSTLACTQSGTWTVQQGSPPWAIAGTTNVGSAPVNPPVSVAGIDAGGLKRNVKLDTNGNVQILVNDTSGNGITSDNAGSSSNRRLNVDTPDITTTSTALGALNASVSIPVTGMGSVGFQLNAGTFIGTLQPQCSIDGGTTWASANFYNPSTNLNSTSYSFTSSNPTTVLGLVGIAGSSHCRVTVSSYTSGTANAIMRASQITGASGSIPSTVSLNNFYYDDMNAANGGVARNTTFVVGTPTTLYTHSGSGTVYGFTLNLQGLGGAQIYSIDLQLDANHIFGASGITTGDLLNSAEYDISQVSTDVLGFAGWAFPDKAIRWTVPGGGQVSYSTSVTVRVTQTAGGAGKFNAGLIALTR